MYNLLLSDCLFFAGPDQGSNTKITNKSFLQWNNESSIRWFYIFLNARTTQLAKYSRLFLDLKKSL